MPSTYRLSATASSHPLQQSCAPLPRWGRANALPALIACLFIVLVTGLGGTLAHAQDNDAPPATTTAMPVPTPDVAAPPDALWQMIHDRCAPAAVQHRYPPLPCIEVDDADGPAHAYAVLKDLKGQYQYLVLPLAHISGIESPALLTPGAANYFADAWTARLYVEAALHHPMPRDALALVVNSPHGRSQNQLHIHIDCIRPDVHAALERMRSSIGTQWTRLPAPLPPFGHMYWARRVGGETLALNPFQSLAASLLPGDSMSQHSLAVTGMTSNDGAPGFVLLSGRFDLAHGDKASSDELLDHTCALAAASTH